MTGPVNPSAQVLASQAALQEQQARREKTVPAGGLLIAVGTSLILWAVIAQAARFASSLLF